MTYNTCVFQSGRYKYSGVLGALRCVCRTEGPKALFSGLTATLLRDAPFSGIYVMIYSQAKYTLPQGLYTYFSFTCVRLIRTSAA